MEGKIVAAAMARRVRIIEIALLAMGVLATMLPLLCSMLFMLIAMMFCDNGPFARCVGIGEDVLLIALALDAGPLSGTLALIRPNARIARGILAVCPFWLLAQALALSYGAMEPSVIPPGWGDVRRELALAAVAYWLMAALFAVRAAWGKAARKAMAAQA